LALAKFQWVYSQLGKAETMMTSLGKDGNAPLNAASLKFPYKVPNDCWVGITYAQVASKFNHYERDSYLVIPGILSVPSSIGEIHPVEPIWVGPGFSIEPYFINNFNEDEWMTCVVQAVIIDGLWANATQAQREYDKLIRL
jgi:hypothetical protein